MTNKSLSPAAQAVMNAFLGDAEDTGLQMDDLRENVAAALLAAADQVLIRPGMPSSEYSLLMQMIDRDFRTIAAELENN